MWARREYEIAMKKMLLLTMATFLVGLFLGSVARAQGTTGIHGVVDAVEVEETFHTMPPSLEVL